MSRQTWVVVHRYAGLCMALFVSIAGLTGSILAFAPQIDRLLHPPLRVAVRSDSMLDPLELRRLAELSVPGSMATFLPLAQKPGEAVRLGLEPRVDSTTGAPATLLADSVWLDPYTGAVIDRRLTYSDLWPVNRDNFLAVLIRLHYSMALPGSWGTWLFGIAAVLWTLDCFVSAYLTFPLRVRRESSVPARSSWWSRWAKAWRVKWRGTTYRVNFDLHRAGGLWPWVLLFVLAWTSVGFNLHDQVYVPVMRSLFTYQDPFHGRSPVDKPDESPPIAWHDALKLGRQHMHRLATEQHFAVESEQYMYYLPAYASYEYVVRSDRDLDYDGGFTYLLLSARDGTLEGFSIPRGFASGNTVESWMYALHVASIWGLPYRILLSLVGLVVAMLSVTGVYIWWRKRSSRLWSRKRAAAEPAPGTVE